MCSFDILKDDLGGPRSSFPHAMYVVAGTQAQHANQNYIALMRLSDINQGRHGSKARNEDDDDMSDSDDEDAPPQIHTNRVAHHGGVNRMRCMPQQPAVVASWGDTGLVQVGCPAELAVTSTAARLSACSRLKPSCSLHTICQTAPSSLSADTQLLPGRNCTSCNRQETSSLAYLYIPKCCCLPSACQARTSRRCTPVEPRLGLQIALCAFADL